jgi:hypothetical protein
VIRQAALAAAVALVLVLAAPAAATDVRLDWREQIKDGRGHVVMTFRVHGLVVDKTGWAAAITFRNLSAHRIRISPDFGLALYKTRTPGDHPDRFSAATRTQPEMPGSLAAGARWTGAVGGPGKPPSGMYVRVVFGHFSGLALPGLPNGFTWITDHVYRMPSGPVA